ncbi:hypothetical protein [Pseudonocardia sp. T1-2H]|uniref:hypothetical protein n=1 Tax=Pseudonocardia sp. T1-2H TaxID=3128899 RepID=UPI0031017264
MTATFDPTRQLAPSGPLVEEDREHHRFRVHRSTMTSPEIHALELERVFGHSWLYVGHESEIREPGTTCAAPSATGRCSWCGTRRAR